MKNFIKVKNEGEKGKKQQQKTFMMASNTPARHIMLPFHTILTQAF